MDQQQHFGTNFFFLVHLSKRTNKPVKKVPIKDIEDVII